MRRRRWIRPFLSGVLPVLGVVAVVILIMIVVQGFGGQVHPIAGWALNKLDKIFTPIGQWFMKAPDWAWICLVLVINIPAAIILTWALHVSGLGIPHNHRPYWVGFFWIILVCIQLAVVYWVRQMSWF